MIPHEEIEEAVVLVGFVHMLKLRWRGNWCQFGLRSRLLCWGIPDPFWLGDTPFPVKKRDSPDRVVYPGYRIVASSNRANCCSRAILTQPFQGHGCEEQAARKARGESPASSVTSR
jgi:hypothetical protein